MKNKKLVGKLKKLEREIGKINQVNLKSIEGYKKLKEEIKEKNAYLRNIWLERRMALKFRKLEAKIKKTKQLLKKEYTKK